MSSKYIKKYAIPPGFQDLLSEFTKEILRNQPKDIIDFGIEYFKCLQHGLILDYPEKGPNIPCDFKPGVPKIPQSLKNLRNPILENAMQNEQQSQQIEEPAETKRKEENIPKKEKTSPKHIITKEPEEDKQVFKEKIGKIVPTNEDESKNKRTSSVVTRTSGKNTNFENCIDFEEKESILLDLKKKNADAENELEEYMFNDK